MYAIRTPISLLALVTLAACAPPPATKSIVIVPPSQRAVDGGGDYAHLRVEHRDRVSSFRLIGAEYAIDGAVVARRGGANQPPLPDGSSAVIYDADVPATPHRLTVSLAYFTGNPTPYGYDHVFRVDSAYEVVVAGGGSAVVLESVDDVGGVTTPLEERFAVKWSATP